jgi:hypothetical protein
LRTLLFVARTVWVAELIANWNPCLTRIVLWDALYFLIFCLGLSLIVRGKL